VAREQLAVLRAAALKAQAAEAAEAKKKA